MRNFKNLKYSWETDPRIKAWEDECRKIRVANISKLAFPTRVKVDGEWVEETGEGQPTVECPPDPRTDEERSNDWLKDIVWDWNMRKQKSHVYSIKCIKTELRRQLKRVHQLKNGTYKQGFIKYDLPSAIETFQYYEHLQMGGYQKIHWTVYVDYVNERFGLSIRKDLFTDKELEKGKLIIDVPNTPLAIGGTDAT